MADAKWGWPEALLEFTHPEMVAASAPDHVALCMADSGEVLTYRDIAATANRLARLFAALGLAHGDTIACILPSGSHMFVTVWAAKNAGLRYVMIGTRLNDADIAHIARDSGARLLVTLPEFASRIAAMGLAADLRLALADGEHPAFANLAALSSSLSSDPLPGRRRGASMLYSSGTTGRPKGVKAVLADLPPEEPPARHAALLRNYGLDTNTVFVTAAPLYHAGPLRIAMAVQRVGGTVIALRKFDPLAMLAAIERHRATHGFFVPTMFQRMLDLPEAVRAAFDLQSMRHAIHGAAPCSVGLKRSMIDWRGPTIDELYGGTESIGQTCISSAEWLRHPGSVGRASGLVEVKIVDEAGAALPPRQTGRVKIRNPQRFSYHGAAAQTGDEIYDAEGFAGLGDVGFLDEEGYLYLTDRENNMIISGGVNIYPQEAEQVLLAHPAVSDVAVIGVPDRDLGEVAKALICLAPGYAADSALGAALLAFCWERLSRHKCPRSLDFVVSLPRSELGKLVRRDIPLALCEAAGALRERPFPKCAYHQPCANDG